MADRRDDPLAQQMTYLGWSGFQFNISENCHIFIDPPKGTVFSEKADIIIFITHGHPEHLGGTYDHVRTAGQGRDTTIIASRVVSGYLAKKCCRDGVNFITVKAGQKSTLPPDIAFEVFSWRHMPLLPPGFGAAVRHMVHILRGLPLAWRIIRMSLAGPRGAGDMLGYLLRLPGDRNIIIYGEGLHRHTHIGDVRAIGRTAPGATLLVATEPEDIAELPGLVVASGAACAILYEPHRPWRDMFELPHADLPALRKLLSDVGISAGIAGTDK